MNPPIDENGEPYLRKDDLRIEKVIKDVGKLEGAVSELRSRQETIFEKLEAERDDHFQIRTRMEYVKNKLEKIELAVVELRQDKQDRDKKVLERNETMEALRVAIKDIHISLTDLTTGTHALVHRWAESEMQSAAASAQFKKKIYETLITKLATGLLWAILAVFLMGLYTYFSTYVKTVVSEDSPDLTIIENEAKKFQ